MKQIRLFLSLMIGLIFNLFSDSLRNFLMPLQEICRGSPVINSLAVDRSSTPLNYELRSTRGTFEVLALNGRVELKLSKDTVAYGSQCFLNGEIAPSFFCIRPWQDLRFSLVLLKTVLFEEVKNESSGNESVCVAFFEEKDAEIDWILLQNARKVEDKMMIAFINGTSVVAGVFKPLGMIFWTLYSSVENNSEHTKVVPVGYLAKVWGEERDIFELRPLAKQTSLKNGAK